jgi:predicted XRE-type DNA-binding protein
MEKKFRADFPQHIDRTKNRSDHYQSNLLEISCDPSIITRAMEDDGMATMLNPFSYNEEEEELKEELRLAFWRLVNTKLTSRQKEVITLYCQKLTQTEIAKLLSVNQSSITKSMNGNCDYNKGKNGEGGKDGGRTNYGGSKKKLSRAAEEDEEIQIILKKLRELGDL